MTHNFSSEFYVSSLYTKEKKLQNCNFLVFKHTTFYLFLILKNFTQFIFFTKKGA